MSQFKKLLQRFMSIPKDLEYDELKHLLEQLGYEESMKGKTSGSRMMFIHQSNGTKLLCHKPHGGNPVNTMDIKQIIGFLRERGEI